MSSIQIYQGENGCKYVRLDDYVELDRSYKQSNEDYLDLAEDYKNAVDNLQECRVELARCQAELAQYKAYCKDLSRLANSPGGDIELFLAMCDYGRLPK